jgi:hypothetical protein
LAQAEAQVLQEALEWSRTPGLVSLFPDQCRVAERTLGGIAGLIRWQAAVALLFLFKL